RTSCEPAEITPETRVRVRRPLTSKRASSVATVPVALDPGSVKRKRVAPGVGLGDADANSMRRDDNDEARAASTADAPPPRVKSCSRYGSKKLPQVPLMARSVMPLPTSPSVTPMPSDRPSPSVIPLTGGSPARDQVKLVPGGSAFGMESS